MAISTVSTADPFIPQKNPQIHERKIPFIRDTGATGSQVVLQITSRQLKDTQQIPIGWIWPPPCNSGIFWSFALMPFELALIHIRVFVCVPKWWGPQMMNEDETKHGPTNTGRHNTQNKGHLNDLRWYALRRILQFSDRGVIKRHRQASSLPRTTNQQIINGIVCLVNTS